ncbi:MAG: MBL fold metallo-hydrolase [Sedimentisphaerales bacterium]|nr:MBL fold metallo-hydrolase [Sedimentisphaerales bacterium]
MRFTLGALVTAASLILSGSVQASERAERLDIYFLDMYGGGSTLIVTPLGESVLIDTGSLRPEHRDVDRICRACQEAGVKTIDYLITTHFHSDHFGGLPELVRRIPVRVFLDKGAPAPPSESNSRWFRELYPLYQEATKGQAKAIGAGDDIPLKNDPAGRIAPIRLHCVAAEERVEGFDGDVDAPVEGFDLAGADETDNARSIALVLTYGAFRFFAGGDITRNVELHLAQPVNRIGQVDLYQVTHHGLDQSNNPVLVKALSPTVAVAMNGPRKGIQPQTFKALTALPSLQALYQIHYNTQYGDAGNAAPEFIANRENPDRGEFIKASVYPAKGVFTVRIGPDGEAKTYPIQAGAAARIISPARFEHIAFNVQDPVAVAKWYCDYLGMKVVRSGPAPAFATFVSDAGGNMMFELYRNVDAPMPDQRRTDPNSFHVAFETDDVKATRDMLLGAGATVAKDIWSTDAGDVVIILRDPWGLPIQFLKRTERMLRD